MKKGMCYFSDDGKFNSVDKRAVHEYNLKNMIRHEFNSNEKKLEDLVSYMIDNAQWFYEFFNEICYPESCSFHESVFVEDPVDINIGGKGTAVNNDC